MMAILLVGILFVALVTYNQQQSIRHEDNLAAQAMAEAGIQYATYMLENSPEGADWRPPEPPAMYADGSYDPGIYGPDGIPGTEDDYYSDMELSRGWAPVIDTATDSYENRGFTRYPDPRHPSGADVRTNADVGGGYFFLRVTYDPWNPYTDWNPLAADTRPPDATDWHISIESIGRVDGTQVYRQMVAYKPVPTLNYARWVHDATQDGRPAFLGISPWIDMDQDGNIETGPVGAAETPPEWISTTFDGPILVNGRLRVAGAPHDTGTEVFASTQFNLVSLMDRNDIAEGEYPRDDTVVATDGIDFLTNVDNAAQALVRTPVDDYGVFLHPSDDPAFTTANGRVKDGRQQTSIEPTLEDTAVTEGYSRFAGRMEAPRLTLGEGETMLERYRRMTRDTGQLVQDDGEYVNNGRWGFGRGIYIDNFTDIQFDHDIQALLDDWQRPSATPGTPMPDSGWNALFTTYSPPAVEIEFLPTEDAAGPFSDSENPQNVTSNEVWWPNHEPGQPGIRITRHDRNWRVPADVAGGPSAGSDSGHRTIVMDYPTPWLTGDDDTVRYPLIVTEGNVRVSGRLPAGWTVDNLRLYDMTIISGGTIYIDGQILAPNDHDMHRAGEARPFDDPLNTKVALFARDSVCLNATRIVAQDTFGAAPAAPDDPLNPADPNKHWELSPGSDGRGYSLFHWGDEPIGESVALVARQTANDPGPSGVALMLWDEATNSYTAYEFGVAPDPMDDETFALVPEETLFPEEPPVTPPQEYGVVAVEPQWAPYRAWLNDDPNDTVVLPWDLVGYVDPTVGLKNALVLRHADPHLGAGSTAYWLKKWKIAEYDADGNAVGGINARVNASVFAERGCWYVLGPGYFDDGLTGDEAIENRRYNYRLTFVGTIAENFTASVEAARDWTDEMAYPAAYDGGDLAEWGSVNYIFDESLRIERFLSTVSNATNPAANLPRLPLLPVSPDMVYYGE
ncbi:MAG: hypothetical protein R6V07_07995 [Armatimonadota bacterium]